MKVFLVIMGLFGAVILAVAVFAFNIFSANESVLVDSDAGKSTAFVEEEEILVEEKPEEVFERVEPAPKEEPEPVIPSYTPIVKEEAVKEEGPAYEFAENELFEGVYKHENIIVDPSIVLKRFPEIDAQSPLLTILTKYVIFGCLDVTGYENLADIDMSRPQTYINADPVFSPNKFSDQNTDIFQPLFDEYVASSGYYGTNGCVAMFDEKGGVLFATVASHRILTYNLSLEDKHHAGTLNPGEDLVAGVMATEVAKYLYVLSKEKADEVRILKTVNEVEGYNRRTPFTTTETAGPSGDFTIFEFRASAADDPIEAYALYQLIAD